MVLEVKGAPTKKRHLLGLCRTRWAERHTCFDTLAEMYLYAFISLEAIAFPHLHHDLALVIPTDSDSEEWNWQHDRETKLQAQGLHSMLQNSQFINCSIYGCQKLPLHTKRNDYKITKERY